MASSGVAEADVHQQRFNLRANRHHQRTARVKPAAGWRVGRAGQIAPQGG